jgi:hypothetical protein
MRSKNLVLVLSLLAVSACRAQTNLADSLKLANTLKELFSICRSVDFKDPRSFDLGLFYKAAPYIIYRGEDKARAWKDLANYKNENEKKLVDGICERINGTINRDPNFKIVQYILQKESEGTWHVLLVTYDKKGITKRAAFAFLKIGDKFALGDID